MVCDFRKRKRITIKDLIPLPLLEETLYQVDGAKIFSQFDLVGAYHQLCTKEEDVQNTYIRIRFGSYELYVLFFGLTNASVAFT